MSHPQPQMVIFRNCQWPLLYTSLPVLYSHNTINRPMESWSTNGLSGARILTRIPEVLTPLPVFFSYFRQMSWRHAQLEIPCTFCKSQVVLLYAADELLLIIRELIIIYSFRTQRHVFIFISIYTRTFDSKAEEEKCPRRSGRETWGHNDLDQGFPTFLTRGALFRINVYGGAPCLPYVLQVNGV